MTVQSSPPDREQEIRDEVRLAKFEHRKYWGNLPTEYVVDLLALLDAARAERDEAWNHADSLAADHYFARAEQAEAERDRLAAELAEALAMMPDVETAQDIDNAWRGERDRLAAELEQAKQQLPNPDFQMPVHELVERHRVCERRLVVLENALRKIRPLVGHRSSVKAIVDAALVASRK